MDGGKAPGAKTEIGSRVIPTMRYRDAPAMIDWLCEVIGFDRHMVVDGDDGGVVHAELTLGGGMIMLGSARDDAFGCLQPAPDDKPAPQSAYVIVEDVDAVHGRAVAKGATVELAPKDEDYGGRSCSFRDPEGMLWNVGSYDPWAAQTS